MMMQKFHVRVFYQWSYLHFDNDAKADVKDSVGAYEREANSLVKVVLAIQLKPCSDPMKHTEERQHKDDRDIVHILHIIRQTEL